MEKVLFEVGWSQTNVIACYIVNAQELTQHGVSAAAIAAARRELQHDLDSGRVKLTDEQGNALPLTELQRKLFDPQSDAFLLAVEGQHR
jgi:hypothetical protein